MRLQRGRHSGNHLFDWTTWRGGKSERDRDLKMTVICIRKRDKNIWVPKVCNRCGSNYSGCGNEVCPECGYRPAGRQAAFDSNRYGPLQEPIVHNEPSLYVRAGLAQDWPERKGNNNASNATYFHFYR